MTLTIRTNALKVGITNFPHCFTAGAPPSAMWEGTRDPPCDPDLRFWRNFHHQRPIGPGEQSPLIRWVEKHRGIAMLDRFWSMFDLFQ